MELEIAVKNLIQAKLDLEKAVIGACLSGMPYADIAKVLGVSRQAVQQRYGPIVKQIESLL